MFGPLLYLPFSLYVSPCPIPHPNPPHLTNVSNLALTFSIFPDACKVISKHITRAHICVYIYIHKMFVIILGEKWVQGIHILLQLLF